MGWEDYLLENHQCFEMIGVVCSHLRLLGFVVQGDRSPLELRLWGQDGENGVERRNALWVGFKET